MPGFSQTRTCVQTKTRPAPGNSHIHPQGTLMKELIAQLIDTALQTLIADGTLPADIQPNIMVENTLA